MKKLPTSTYMVYVWLGVLSTTLFLLLLTLSIFNWNLIF